ncbi:hypothetical protein J6590_033455 [Homalodisca vitripennis]|nr:hypothetical protein J6590_033455 [Homalodisca vitripennis]
MQLSPVFLAELSAIWRYGVVICRFHTRRDVRKHILRQVWDQGRGIAILPVHCLLPHNYTFPELSETFTYTIYNIPIHLTFMSPCKNSNLEENLPNYTNGNLFLLLGDGINSLGI